MWRGQLTFETPMLFVIGFLVTFLLGGLTGVLLASPPLDWQVTDSYFVVAHFHYVVFGTVVFAAYGGIYFWFPKMCGRMMDERLGKLHFWLTFIGFHGTFLIQHWLGDEGMARRYADYLPTDGFTTLNIDLHDRRVRPRRLDPPVPLQRGEVLEVRAARAARRPVGPRQLPGVGDVVAAAAAQLPGDPPHPLGAARVRGALPAPASTGCTTRRTRAGGTTPYAERTGVGGHRVRGRARTTPTRPEATWPVAGAVAVRAAARPRRRREIVSSLSPESDDRQAVEGLTDHGRGQATAVALAGQHADQPAGRGGPVEPAHAPAAPLDQPPGGLPLVVVVDRLHRLGGDLRVDALGAQLGRERPPGQTPTGLPGADPGAGEGCVVDQADLAEPVEHRRPRPCSGTPRLASRSASC